MEFSVKKIPNANHSIVRMTYVYQNHAKSRMDMGVPKTVNANQVIALVVLFVNLIQLKIQRTDPMELSVKKISNANHSFVRIAFVQQNHAKMEVSVSITTNVSQAIVERISVNLETTGPTMNTVKKILNVNQVMAKTLYW